MPQERATRLARAPTEQVRSPPAGTVVRTTTGGAEVGTRRKFGTSLVAGALAVALMVPLPAQASAAAGWQQVAELAGSASAPGFGGALFGGAVAIWEGTAVVGAEGYNPAGYESYTGRAYVFSDTSTGWQQVAELEGSDTVYDDFGLSVAISGTTIVVGAPVDNSETGRVHVFRQTATDWHQTAELNGSDSANGDYFGNSVAISGNTVVGGAWIA